MAFTHGASAYRGGLCHCLDCTEAHRLRHWDERDRRRAATAANGGIAPAAQHNASTYLNWGCRCPACRASHGERMRYYSRRRRAPA
jgi:hypothetical protein